MQAVTVGKQEDENDEYGFDAETFDDSEFEYFYNMELLEKLELLSNNDTEVDETMLSQLAEDDLTEYEDTTELDVILDKLLEEGNLIEEVLDEIEDEILRTTLFKDDSFMENFDRILFYGFLIAFVFMFTISSVFTGIHFCKKHKSQQADSEENKAEVEFVFSLGQDKHHRQSQKRCQCGNCLIVNK